MIVELHGIKFAYNDQGHGTPILFIHGYPLSHKIWLPQIEYLSKLCRTISLDLRGHGESREIPGPYTMDMLAIDCKALLDSLQLNRPIILCGLSMGGYISLAFLRQFPSQVAGLILASTRANADTTEGQKNREKAIALAEQFGPAAIAESMLSKMFAPDTYITSPALVSEIRDMMSATSIEGIVGALNGMKNRIDSTSNLPFIEVPTLIVHGVEDQLIPLSVAHDMHTAIPGSTLAAIPGAGHLLNLEQPRLFNQVVENFMLAHAYGR